MREYWISEEFERLARMVKDYDEFLEFQWIAPEDRVTVTDRAAPYRILDTRNNKVVMYATEVDTPTEILARLFEADNLTGDVLKKIDAHNAAVKAIQLKKELDEREAAMDFSAFVVGNRKNYWKHDGIKYDSNMRRI